MTTQTQNKPLAGTYIRYHEGASSDLPVFRKNTRWNKEEQKHEPCDDSPRYKFDTYGAVPVNYKDWNARHLGMGGAFGETDDVNVLVESIKHLNSKGISAPVCDLFFEECLAMGATELKTRECPK